MYSYESYKTISNISKPLSNTIDSKYITKKNKDIYNKKYKYFGIRNIIKYFENKKIKYNLENRIFYYNNINDKLLDISDNECLKSVKNYNTNSYNYVIKNIISLEKRIGSSSKYGYIYITKIKNEIGKYPIAAKLMEQDFKNTNESELNKKITDIIIKKKISKHFILTYKVINCNNVSNNNLPHLINNKKYIMLLNELAHGDLKSLCKKKEFFINDDILYNVFSQIMLSILTFQYFGYIHRDCHWGNFLYHYTNNDNKNNNKYYHYNINKKNYYLKSCPYSIYIYDFGLSKKIIYANTIDISEDYVRLLSAFINKNNYRRSWLVNFNIPPNLPSDNFSNFIIKFENTISNIYKNYQYLQNYKFLKIISDTLIDILLNMPNNIFTDKKPLNVNIINKKPYYINNKIKLK